MNYEIILSLIILLGIISSIIFFYKKKLVIEKEETYKRHVSILLTAGIRKWFYWFVSPVEKILINFKVHPTWLNFSGLFFSIIASIYFYLGKISYGGWFIILGGICDTLDGKIARATGKNSLQGAFMDSNLDRYAEIIVYFGLLSHFQNTFIVYPIMASLSGALMVSYTKARGEGLGVSCEVGIMQRPERIVYLGAGSIFTPLFDKLLKLCSINSNETLLIITLIFIAILSNITAIYRFIYIVNKLKEKN